MSDTPEAGTARHPIRALCRNGTGWRAHGLERDADGSHVFRALPGQGLLLGVAMGVGGAALALAGFALIAGEFAALVVSALVGASFLGTAVLLRPIMMRGARIRPTARIVDLPAGMLGGETPIRFDDVAAVQYVPYRKHGTEPLRVIHGEIDLLLRTGRRLTVVNHDALERMRADAATLARVIGVPLHEHPVDEGGAAAPRHPQRTDRQPKEG